jgi:hypothetical protein
MVNDDEKRAFFAKNEFYSNVGQAISAWSGMESVLVGAASILLEVHPEKAGLVLYSNQNFHVWLNIIDGLFELEPKFANLKPTWTKISNDLRGMNDTRVGLAHHSVFHHSLELFEQNPLLKPSPFDARTKSRKHQPLTANEILAFTDKISAMIGRLGKLNVAMKNQRLPASPDKSAQLPDDQPK